MPAEQSAFDAHTVVDVQMPAVQVGAPAGHSALLLQVKALKVAGVAVHDFDVPAAVKLPLLSASADVAAQAIISAAAAKSDANFFMIFVLLIFSLFSKSFLNCSGSLPVVLRPLEWTQSEVSPRSKMNKTSSPSIFPRHGPEPGTARLNTQASQKCRMGSSLSPAPSHDA